MLIMTMISKIVYAKSPRGNKGGFITYRKNKCMCGADKGNKIITTQNYNVCNNSICFPVKLWLEWTVIKSHGIQY